MTNTEFNLLTVFSLSCFSRFADEKKTEQKKIWLVGMRHFKSHTLSLEMFLFWHFTWRQAWFYANKSNLTFLPNVFIENGSAWFATKLLSWIKWEKSTKIFHLAQLLYAFSVLRSEFQCFQPICCICVVRVCCYSLLFPHLILCAIIFGVFFCISSFRALNWLLYSTFQTTFLSCLTKFWGFAGVICIQHDWNVIVCAPIK